MIDPHFLGRHTDVKLDIRHEFVRWCPLHFDNSESMLDGSINVIIPHCFPALNTSYHSQEPGKTAVEQIQRLHGTSIIHDAVQNILTTISKRSDSDEDDAKAFPWNLDDDIYKKICLDVSCTACVLLHRFYHTPGGSIYEFDVWSMSTASLLLATKLHDLSMISVRTVIHAFASIYRQRVLGTDLGAINDNLQQGSVALPPDGWNRLSIEERRRRLDEGISLPIHGPIYLEWYNAISSAECRLLHHLGFVVYWIPDHHAHNFVESFCRDIDIALDPNAKDTRVNLDERQRILAREAYQICRTASFTDLCVRYLPERIACATIQCAALKMQYVLRSNRSQSDSRIGKASAWWIDLWKTNPNELDDIKKDINAIILILNHVEEGSDFQMASHGFVASKLTNNGSFNDPGSFVWEMLIEKVAAG